MVRVVGVVEVVDLGWLIWWLGCCYFFGGVGWCG